MPLKIAAILQNGDEHPDDINDTIIQYHDCNTYGNRYVRLYLGRDDNDADDGGEILVKYVLDMGFDEESIILVDAEREYVDAVPDIQIRPIPPLDINPEQIVAAQRVFIVDDLEHRNNQVGW